MSCHFECNNNTNTYLVYSVLKRNILNQEFVGRYIFCSAECMKRFEEEYTYIENGYTYYNELADPPRCYCPSMMEKVKEHKDKFGIDALIKSLHKTVIKVE